MTFILDEGLRGYWENPAFVIGVAVLVIGAFLLLLIVRTRGPSGEGSGDGLSSALTVERTSWLIAGAAGAALLVAGVVYNPAFAVGGGFIVLVASVRLLMD